MGLFAGRSCFVPGRDGNVDGDDGDGTVVASSGTAG